jgi:MoaA/NifB/PqqE/SkfB family radical SAM enzyme
MATRGRMFLKLAAERLYMPPVVTVANWTRRAADFIPFKPLTGVVLVTHACNFKCRMCAFGRGEKPVGELTADEIRSVIREFKEIGLVNVLFSGGEPLLRKELPDLVAYAKGLGFPNILCFSNGSLLTEKRAVELLDAGVNSFSISVDGYGPTHEKQRQVPGAWKKTTDALRLLARLRDTQYPDLLIDMPMTVTLLNSGEIPQMVELCSELKVGMTLQFLEHASFFGCEHVDDDMGFDKHPDEVDRLIEQLHGYIGHPVMSPLMNHLSLEYIRRYLRRDDVATIGGPPCAAGYFSVYVDALGRVYSGCWGMPQVGNVRDRTLVEIVRSSGYKQNLQEMLDMNCPTCPNGFQWSVWYHVPSTLKELAFRSRRRLEQIGGPRPAEPAR